MIRIEDFDISQSVFSGSYAKPSRQMVKSSELFKHENMKDTMLANCCLAGALLFYGYLKESLRLSQKIKTPEGNYWHAIMHRVEGDYENSRYWLKTIPHHSIYSQVHKELKEKLTNKIEVLQKLLDKESWDPIAYVDLIEELERTKDIELTKAMSMLGFIEWKALYEFCYINGIRI